MIKAEFSYVKFIETVTALLLLLYPSMMFAIKGGMNGSFLVLLLLSLSVLLIRPKEISPIVWDKNLTWYMWAMAALPIAIFLSQSYHHTYSWHPYDAASRFLLAVPVFIVLRRVRFNVVATVQYGFPFAAMTGLLMINEPIDGRAGISTLDLIHFGDFELVLGVMSILSLNWTGRDKLIVRTLKIFGFVAGAYASVVSGSRGGWIAIPIFLLIYIYFKVGKLSFRVFFATLLILVTTGLLTYLSIEKIQNRVDNTVADLAIFNHGNSDTSVGIRLQLYRTAVNIISENPLFGVGPEGFAREMDSYVKAGKITPTAAEYGRGEVHNEILSRTAGMGLFGLVAILLIYFIPLLLFYRAMHSASVFVRQAGVLGLVFVSGFIVFGLTAETLNLTMATAFYGLTVAVFLAACLNIHHAEPANTNSIKGIHYV